MYDIKTHNHFIGFKFSGTNYETEWPRESSRSNEIYAGEGQQFSMDCGDSGGSGFKYLSVFTDKGKQID